MVRLVEASLLEIWDDLRSEAAAEGISVKRRIGPGPACLPLKGFTTPPEVLRLPAGSRVDLPSQPSRRPGSEGFELAPAGDTKRNPRLKAGQVPERSMWVSSG